MHPILPSGSVVAIDRSIRDPSGLEGRIVAARVEDRAVIRWLELSGRHLILRPNRPGPGSPTVALEPSALGSGSSPILGQVVWSWSRFS
jgi:SOS-response transcriptional repressor LexA